MTRSLAVLRPEPGNAATAARIEARGLSALRLPLFAVRALPWTAPPPERYDALLLTSANTIRLAGPALAGLGPLPVYAVGQATAIAARDAGLTVRRVGDADAAALLADAHADGVRRALHLGGRDTTITCGPGIADSVAVYASEAMPIAPARLAALSGSVALLHSRRAAARLAALAPDRASLRLAALSAAVADAAGTGWNQLAVAAAATDVALIDVARALTD